VDIVRGVSMAPTTVRLLLIEGVDADGVTIEEDTFDVGDPAASGAVEQVIAAIDGTREGVMLVSPLLAAAALAQAVGQAIGYEHIAMLFVEPDHATLAVVEVSDGSIVDLHRRVLANARPEAPREALAAELATILAALDARGSWADGVFLIGCGTDIVSIKPALEAVTPLDVTAPEEPDMALARGAALASANAPLFASSTAALAYALDPDTGEIPSPRADPDLPGHQRQRRPGRPGPGLQRADRRRRGGPAPSAPAVLADRQRAGGHRRRRGRGGAGVADVGPAGGRRTAQTACQRRHPGKAAPGSGPGQAVPAQCAADRRGRGRPAGTRPGARAGRACGTAHRGGGSATGPGPPLARARAGAAGGARGAARTAPGRAAPAARAPAATADAVSAPSVRHGADTDQSARPATTAARTVGGRSE